MEHEIEQKGLFPQEPPVPTSSSKAAPTSADAEAPTSAVAEGEGEGEGDAEGVANENEDGGNEKGVSVEEMKEHRPPLTGACAKCGETITAERPALLYNGQAYHHACLPFRSDLKSNPRISFSLSARASQLAHLLELLSLNEGMKDLYDHIADILCEHDSWYTRCAECGDVVEKHAAIIGGAHTRKVKEETGAVVSVSSGKFFSRVRSTEVFCCDGHDLNYSRRLLKVWEEKKAERAAAKDSSTEKGKRINAGLRALLKIAKTNKDVEGKLAEILALIKD